MWELPPAEPRATGLTGAAKLGTGSIWLFYVRETLRSWWHSGSSYPPGLFSPLPSLPSRTALHLLCPSTRALPKCHQTAQFIKGPQSYHNLSPGNFYKLEIGAISVSVEIGQSSLYSAHHLGVIKRGQQGAVWAHLSQVFRRVYAQRDQGGLSFSTAFIHALLI